MRSCIDELKGIGRTKRNGFDISLNNPIVHGWIRLGRRHGSLYFELSRPTQQELRKLAHLLTETYPDRHFKYGRDDDGDPLIEVSIVEP